MKRWSCAGTSWGRPTSSSRCSPANTDWSGRRQGGAGGPGPSSGVWNRSRTWICTCTRDALDTITQAHTLHAFCDVIAADYGRYTTGCAIVETAERLAGEERAPAARLHQLTVGALTALAEDRRPRELILDAFLLRAMSYAGWMPSLSECARCGRPGPHRAFHVAAGGAVCAYWPSARRRDTVARCAGADGRAVPGRMGQIDSVSDSVSRQASGLTAAHLQWHLERQLANPAADRTVGAA